MLCRKELVWALCASVATYVMGRSCKNADMKNAMRAILCGAALCAPACSSQAPPPGAATSASGPTLAQLPDVDMTAVLAHTRTLSSDEFEGRAPGTDGERRTVDYLVSEFTKAGLKPGNTDGTFIQKVPLVGITPTPVPLILRNGGRQQTLKWKDDVVAWTKHVADSASINASELVFVGYGVQAPEYGWDDYKSVDVKGKTLVMLVNDPPVADAANPGALDAKVFSGKAMTYYGRWTYKYEIGAAKGAAGVLIVHETGPAGYPFKILQDSNTGEKFDLVTPDKNMGRAAIEGWMTLDQAKKLFQMAGQDFDALKKQAATREFKPVALGVTASMTIRNTLRTIESANVVAKLEGADPALRDEYIVYTAHWDHFGKSAEGIFHGARDNASGTAALVEMARALQKASKASPPPRRSFLFVAVTAEEQGLLGSEYYSVTPIYPLARTVAEINMDELNVNGRTKDLTLIGYGASDLDDYAREAAGEQGRTVHADAEPEKGYYYRSDHFNFAKQGVPALSPDSGVEFIGKPPDYAQKVRDEWTEHLYHTPKDVITPAWDLTGAAEDLKLLLAVGYRVSQAAKYPEWKPGNEFKATRDAMLRR
jgi:Zn-dependent M28 family amino/carboxypeptidase